MALKTRYSPFQHLSLTNLLSAFVELPPRSRLTLLAGLGAGFLVILFLPISLLSGKMGTMQKEIALSQKKYGEVVDRLSEYEKMRKRMAALEEKFGRGGGSLTGRIETLARDSGLTVDQLRERPPQETDFLEVNAVEVKLSNVTLSQLTEFLYQLEQGSPLMRVRQLQIKPKTRNRQTLDVSFEVATFLLKKEG